MLAEDLERTVIERARNGDASAARQIYDRYSRYLAATCARFLPDPSDQNDVLQDSFVKIFTSLDKFEFRGDGSFKAWMRQISVNEALKLLRKRRQSVFVKLEYDLPEDIPDEVEEEMDVGDVPGQVLNEMIGDLPEGYRTVLNLFAFEQMSHREIGRQLGISESTSASQLHRARVLLTQKIKDYRKKIKDKNER
ncbi:MAG: sigma-70 family RNA polymerase sigma factor [Bacteroidales bacterium]|nr:sigma-70 family RNA polymerase sigma factor [Bacteroidales bacterium]